MSICHDDKDPVQEMRFGLMTWQGCRASFDGQLNGGCEVHSLITHHYDGYVIEIFKLESLIFEIQGISTGRRRWKRSRKEKSIVRR